MEETVAPQDGVVWLTTRLAKNKRLLTIEAKIAGMEVSLAAVRFKVFTAPDETLEE